MAEQNPYESPQPAPGRSRTPLFILASGACLLFVLLVLCARGLPKSWAFDYDTATHDGIAKKIAADPQYLGGRRLNDVSRELGLDDIPWDPLFTQRVGGSCRMYHFRGFCLYVHLNFAQEDVAQYVFLEYGSAEERLRARDKLRIDPDLHPFVTIDGIGSREERMRQYNARLQAQIDEINKEMKSNRSTRNP